MKSKVRVFVLGMLVCWAIPIKAQIALEVLAGPQRSSLDLMFFHFLGKAESSKGRLLYFNRNRVAQEYRVGDTLFAPQWGWTGALSYNRSSWKGFAPVLSYQISGLEPALKPGIQFAYQHHETTFFSWLVSDPIRQFPVELFALFRKVFPSAKTLKFYLQAESFHRWVSEQASTSFHIHRLRVGLHFHKSQLGLGLDYHHQRVAGQRTSALYPGIFFRTVFS